jgi:hypothetical protein
MQIWLRLIIGLLGISPVIAQNSAVINISSPELNGRKIQIVSMADPINGKEELLAEELVPIDGSNKFVLPCSNDPIAISIRSGDYASDLYLSNLDTAFLRFESSKFTWELERCSCLPLNQSIQRINTSINACFESAYRKPGIPLPAKQTRFFADSLRTFFSDTTIRFVADYLLYKSLYAELSANALTRKQAIIKFLNPKPVLINNPAWVDFFSTLYDGNIRRQLNSRGGDSLKQLLKLGTSLDLLLNQLNRDSLISNPELLKLILLKGIYELGYDRDFSKKQLKSTLIHLSVDSAYASVRNYSLKILKAWSVFEIGSKVPDFSYKPFPERKTKQFSQLIGKPVYLVYFPSFSQVFQKEILMLKAINERYKSEISMLIIINSDDQEGLAADLTKMNPGMEVASYSDCSGSISYLMENRNLQSYFLIDRNNCFWQAPAEGPDTDVEAAFLGLIKYK